MSTVISPYLAPEAAAAGCGEHRHPLCNPVYAVLWLYNVRGTWSRNAGGPLGRFLPGRREWSDRFWTRAVGLFPRGMGGNIACEAAICRRGCPLSRVSRAGNGPPPIHRHRAAPFRPKSNRHVGPGRRQVRVEGKNVWRAALGDWGLHLTESQDRGKGERKGRFGGEGEGGESSYVRPRARKFTPPPRGRG